MNSTPGPAVLAGTASRRTTPSHRLGGLALTGAAATTAAALATTLAAAAAQTLGVTFELPSGGAS